MKRIDPGQQFVENDAVGPDVAQGVNFSALCEQFGRHVADSAYQTAALRQPGRVHLGDSRDAEIHDLDEPFRRRMTLAGLMSRWITPC